MDEPAPTHRAADADRESTAAVLRTAVAEGRLTMEEFDSRVAKAYAARTYADLTALTEDLPTQAPALGLAVESAGRPAREAARAQRARGRGREVAVRRPVPAALWGAYLSANLICFTVWLLVAVTGGGAYPWFLWVAGPWGALLAGREIQGRLR